MFIELSDYLRCPEDHDPEPCIVLPGAMDGRSVAEGLVGCPVCRREYPIRAGRALFGAPRDPAIRQALDPEIVRALLGLDSPGGYVALVGGAASLAADLPAEMKIHFVGINAPPDTTANEALSLMDTAGKLPLKTNSVRGVVLDAAHSGAEWFEEAARIVLPGRHVVVASEEVTAPGLQQLAAGHGFWVGKPS